MHTKVSTTSKCIGNGERVTRSLVRLNSLFVSFCTKFKSVIDVYDLSVPINWPLSVSDFVSIASLSFYDSFVYGVGVCVRK